MKENITIDFGKTEEGMLTGMFRDRKSTESAYNTIQEKGYTKDDINLVMSDETRKQFFSDNFKSTNKKSIPTKGSGNDFDIISPAGVASGIVATIGTSITIPGLGIVIAGPIAAGLAGARAGGHSGSVIGALVGSGIPESRAKLYESGIKEGNIVLRVKTRNDEDAKFFEDDWRMHNGEEIHSY